MRTEDAINFLLYSYFEITLGKNDVDNVIEAAIRRAYKDASSHVLSIDEKIKSDEDPKKRGIEIIAPQVRKLLAGELTYCIFHQETCQKLKEKYEFISGKEGKREFTYGIAQKWVNMTMKYLCIINSIFSQNKIELFGEYGEKLEELEAELHVPIDSYILESASHKEKTDDNKYGLEILIPRKEHCKEQEGFYSADSLAWSKWNFENEEDWKNPNNYYNKFQENVKKAIEKNIIMREDESRVKTPFEWEGLAWIEVAQERKNKEREKEKR